MEGQAVSELRGRFVPHWLEQRWDELATQLLDPDGPRLDGYIAINVRAIAMAAHVKAGHEYVLEAERTGIDHDVMEVQHCCGDDYLCDQAKAIEALPDYSEDEG